jgi:NAD-dependent deacetylase
MDTQHQALIEQAADLIRQASKAVAFTGAGISTHSGIPDFRSPESGLWNKYDPFEVASLTAFRYHPEKFYGWIKPLFKNAQSTQPNQAHISLAALEKSGHLQAVITQNIDGLHQKAGSSNVVELHGSTQSATCLDCGQHYGADWLPEDILGNDDMPRCKACGGVLKPDVTLFEELLPREAWQKAEMLCNQADLILVIGSSLEVYPANSLPEKGIRNGAKLIINTLSATHLDSFADVVIQADLIDTIPPICRQVLESSD